MKMSWKCIQSSMIELEARKMERQFFLKNSDKLFRTVKVGYKRTLCINYIYLGRESLMTSILYKML